MAKALNMRKARDLLIFLALMLSWGEMLAAPFLSCPHSHEPVVQAVPEHHHHTGMDMSAVNSHHDHAMMHADSDTAALVDSANDLTSAQTLLSADCDGTCPFCRGVNTPDVTASLSALPSLLLPWSVNAPSLAVATPPPADHFRPPTYA